MNPSAMAPVAVESAHGRAQGNGLPSQRARSPARLPQCGLLRVPPPVSAAGAQRPVATPAAEGPPWRGFPGGAGRDRGRRRGDQGPLHPARGPLAAGQARRPVLLQRPAQAAGRRRGLRAPFVFYFKGGATLATAEHPPAALGDPRRRWPSSAARRPDAQRLTGTVFGAGTIAAVGLLGRRLAGERVGLIAAGLAAVYPVLIAADGALMTESLFGMLVALSLLAAYRLVDGPSPGRAAGARRAGGPGRPHARGGAAAAPAPPGAGDPPPGGAARRGRGRAGLRAWCSRPGRCATGSVFDQPVLISPTPGSAIAGANCDETYYGDQLGRLAAPVHPRASRQRGREPAPSRGEDGTATTRATTSGRLPVVLAVAAGAGLERLRPAPDPGGPVRREPRSSGVAMLLLLVAAGGVRACILRRRRVAMWILLMPVVAGVLSPRSAPTATSASASPPRWPWWCWRRWPSTRSGAGSAGPPGPLRPAHG